MRYPKKALAAAAGLVVVAGIALTGCGGSSSGGSDSGGHVLTVGIAVGAQTDNSNPFLSTAASTNLGYRFAIYEPLTQVNSTRPTQKPMPWLAKDWKWNADYTQIVFTARNGVKWSDGKPFTAADIAFSLKLRMDNSALNSEGLPYKSVTTQGDKVTVTFKGSQYVNQMKILQLFIVPEHIWKNVAHPDKFLDKNPVGTGPFVLKSWTSQAVTLDANPNYWHGKVAVPQIRYTPYSTNEASATALATGASQWSSDFISGYQKTFVSKDPEHNKVYFPAGLGIDYLALNVAKAPFNDLAVRKVLNMVADREKEHLVAEGGVFPELTNVTGIPTPAGTSFIADTYKNQNYKVDVAGAKLVLTDAGYHYSGSNLLDKNGKQVSFSISDPAGWNDWDTGMTLIAASAQSLGMKTTIETPSANAWTDSIAAGDFQAALHWTNAGISPWEMYSDMFDPAYYVPLGKGATWDYGRYQNDQAKALFKAYTNASDDAARAAALQKLQSIFVKDVPAIAMDARPSLCEYSTKYYTGWPSAQDPYASPQPTDLNAALILSKLKPVS